MDYNKLIKIKSFQTEEGFFDVYDIEKNPIKRAAMFTVFKDKDGWIIRNALIPLELQRKGIATKFYVEMNKMSIKKTGNPLRSTQKRILSNGEIVHELSEDGIFFWESLVEKGYAKKIDNKNYVFMKNKYSNGGELLLAPNGKPSNLTPEQYKLVRTPAFKKWFGDWEKAYETENYDNVSKVIDEETKEPLVVYHGSPKNFNTFDVNLERGKNRRQYSLKGNYFAKDEWTSRQYAGSDGYVKKYFLNARKILTKGTIDKEIIIESLNSIRQTPLQESTIKNLFVFDNIDDFIEDIGQKSIILSGYDGVIDNNEDFIVFSSNQIKLADGTNTTFDGNNPDIRYESGGKVKSEIDYSLKEVYPDIFLFQTESQKDLALSFARCQAFYEWDEFKGKKFTIKDFFTWYKFNHPNLKPYWEEFYGFNVPSDSIFDCYKVNEERNIYDDLLLSAVSKIPNKNFYLIGTVKGDDRALDHELAHAFFWKDEEYRNDMISLVNSIPNKDELLRILKEERGYGKDVLFDEAQAFLSTGLITEISDWQEYTKIFRERFMEQKNKFNNGGTLAPETEIINSENFKRWFKDSKVVDEYGQPLIVYHGTTHEFYEFNKKRGNVVNHFGLGYYFTDSLLDVESNYLSQGEDLKSRIIDMAENLHYNEDVEMDEAKKIATEFFVGEKEIILDCYLSLQNPIDLTENGTRYDAYETFDENDEYVIDENSLTYKLQESIINVSGDFGVNGSIIWSELFDEIMDFDYVTAYKVDKALRKIESVAFLEGDVEDGYKPLGHEFIRRVYEDMGFDGIIMDADLEFGNRRKYGVKMQMDLDTKHYIAFYPEQIKLADGTNTTFDSNNPDIRYADGGIINNENFKKWFDDSYFKNDDGNPIIFYHETKAENLPFIKQNGFDTNLVKSRGNDNLLPDGVFLKDNDKEIGVGGKGDKVQISVYISAKNVLTFRNRNNFYNFLKDESRDFYDAYWASELYDKEMSRIFDTEIWGATKNIKYERGTEEWKKFYEEWDKKSKEFLDNWGNETARLSKISRKLATDILIDKNIQAIVIENDEGSFGRNVYTVVVLNPFNIKSVNNLGTFDRNEKGIIYAKGGELSEDEKKQTYKKWKELVNMSASELKSFMDSDEGKVAGLSKKEANELGIHYGRESAKWILKMKETSVKDWTSNMWRWAKRQISFNSRMRGNKGKLYDEKGKKTRKHLSLLIWGHNPEK